MGKLRGIVWRRRAGVMVMLFLVGLVVRGWRAWQEPVVNPDAIRFIEQAQKLAVDPVGAMRGEVYHPLHSLMGFLVHSVIRGFFADDRMAWLAAMVAVGVFCGAVVAVEIVWISRWFGAPFWGAVAAGVVWVVGRRTSAYGADGISDMLFLMLFAGGMLLGMRALRFRRRWGLWFFLAGVLSGLAYLTRPEGLAVALILMVTVGVMVVVKGGCGGGRWRRIKTFRRRRLGVGKAVAAVGVMMVGVLIVGGPYMVVIRGVTRKKPMEVVSAVRGAGLREVVSPSMLRGPSLSMAHGALVLAVGPPVERATGNSFLDVGKMGMELWETFGFSAMVILLLSVLLKPWYWGRPRVRVVVVVWFWVWVAVMFWLVNTFGYLDGRHTLPVELLLFGMLGMAFKVWERPMRWWMRWYGRRWGLAGWRGWRWWPRVFAGGVVLLAVLPGVIRLGLPPSADQEFIREAADWVRVHTKADTIVCSHKRLVGYYSGRPYAYWFGSPEKPLMGDLEGERTAGHPHVVIGYLYLVDRGEEVRDAIGRFRRIAEFKSKGEGEVLVLYAEEGDGVVR